MAEKIMRRNLLKAAGAAVGVAALGKAVSPLLGWKGLEEDPGFFQKHYRQLSPREMESILELGEKNVKKKWGVDVNIEDLKPEQGVGFAYALNLSTCLGCRQCTEACRKENNHDRATNNSYIRVFEMEEGGIDLSKGNAAYNHAVPKAGKFYMPIQCQHCENAPCTKVCPVQATWKDDDGIVVVDYNWCIGCRYCMAACPYHARRFNWFEPVIEPKDINPNQAYLSNTIRKSGVMEKCTFCLQRTRKGKLPACLEACPAGARVFGNYLDPKSEIRWLVENKRVYILKEDSGTQPRFFYYFVE